MEDKTTRRGHKRHSWIIVTLILLLIVAFGASGVMFSKYRAALQSNPSREQEQIVQKIGSVVELPAEKPIVSTVQNKAKLTNATLRARANNGDKLLIYTKAKRLIIYRPATGKVIDMLTMQSQPSTGTLPLTAE